jgi:hypothetical protein
MSFFEPISKSRSMESLVSNVSCSADAKQQPSSNKHMADVEEIRVNPVVSKRGFLNFLDETTSKWLKKFVVRPMTPHFPLRFRSDDRLSISQFKVVRRPFLFLYNNDRDPLERSFINLSRATIIYNEEQMSMLRVSPTPHPPSVSLLQNQYRYFSSIRVDAKHVQPDNTQPGVSRPDAFGQGRI